MTESTAEWIGGCIGCERVASQIQGEQSVGACRAPSQERGTAATDAVLGHAQVPGTPATAHRFKEKGLGPAA